MPSMVQEWINQSNGSEREAIQFVQKRFENESRIMQRLSHPCFPEAIEGFKTGAAFFLVSEL